MRKRFILGLVIVAVCATSAAAQTSPGRQPQQQQQPQQPQVQMPVQQAPAITQRVPLAGQIPVLILGFGNTDQFDAYLQRFPMRINNRAVHATAERPDYDQDGYRARRYGGPDCDDEDPLRNPGQLDIWEGEGLDEDCDHFTLPNRDFDRDGFISWQAMNLIRTDDDQRVVAVVRGADCDDSRADVHPGLPEILGDLRDNDCDGLIDVVDSRGHGDYCPPTDQVSAQRPTRPCGQAGGNTSQFNRR